MESAVGDAIGRVRGFALAVGLVAGVLLVVSSPLLLIFYSSATSCSGETREAFDEIVQFSPREPDRQDPNPGPDGAQATDGCLLNYEVRASPEEVESHFRSEFREGGWVIERTPDPPKRTPEGLPTTGGTLVVGRKGDFSYTIYYNDSPKGDEVIAVTVNLRGG